MNYARQTVGTLYFVQSVVINSWPVSKSGIISQFTFVWIAEKLTLLKITIPGTPRTKKNSQIMVKGRNLILPSKAYQEYYKFCIGTKRNPGWLMQWGNACFTKPVHVCCQYWFPNHKSRPDLVGLLQATSDLLEAAGIIENDRLIVSYDGSYIVGIDKENPRAEIIIREVK